MSTSRYRQFVAEQSGFGPMLPNRGIKQRLVGKEKALI